MKKNISFFVFIATLLFFLPYSYAESLRAEVSPQTISPGDAFLIKVTNAKTSLMPSASLAKKKFSFTTCGEGCFIAIGAVDLKTRPGKYTVKVNIGKKKKNLKLFVKKTRFPELQITLPDETVMLKTENLERVKREDEKLHSIFETISDNFRDGSFIMPAGNDLSTSFGTKRIMNKKLVSVHKGLDIKGREGEEVRASNNGKVVLTEELFFGGNTVIIDHGQGIYTIYMHLSDYKVKSADIVSKGDIIGLVGSSGRSTGSHLHFGVKVMNISVNPVSLIKLAL